MHSINLCTDLFFTYHVPCPSFIIRFLQLVFMLPHFIFYIVPAVAAYNKHGVARAVKEYAMWFVGAAHIHNIYYTPEHVRRSKEEREKIAYEQLISESKLNERQLHVEKWEIMKHGPLFFIFGWNTIILGQLTHWAQYVSPVSHIISLYARFTKRGNKADRLE